MPRSTPATSLLCRGRLPVEDLAELAIREGWRPRPEYQAHRWFARRFPSVFRALLVANDVTNRPDFWRAFEQGACYRGRTILDPFVGGGTSVVEAQRLGATTVGVDIDPVACAITRFETKTTSLDLSAALQRLKSTVHQRVQRYYITIDEHGKEHTVLHFFWVQRLRCVSCGLSIDAHPHYQLAYEAEGTRQWLICRHCGAIAERHKSARSFQCGSCHSRTPISSGPVSAGTLSCPQCETKERLIDVAQRTKSPPSWHLFALETIESHAMRPTMRDRTFREATDDDRMRYARAGRAFERRLTDPCTAKWTPTRRIPSKHRADNRLLQYGYRQYRELFNKRQLLHLSMLAEAISLEPEETREALSLALSDHLTTNCMMTHYAFGWRRVAPLFAIRAFRHISRPVELNPWLDGIGRGTFPNTVRQVQRAVAARTTACESDSSAGRDAFRNPITTIVNSDSRALSTIVDASVDLVLTDPPYFDNIAYSELADFYVPWLELLRVIPIQRHRDRRIQLNIAASARNAEAGQSYERALSSCLREVQRVLKPSGRLVFTYQHRSSVAWMGLCAALRSAQFRVVQLFPMLGNSQAGPHVMSGTCSWDAVFVAVKSRRDRFQVSTLAPTVVARATRHWRRWSTRLAGNPCVPFGLADQHNFFRAVIVAAALDMFGRTGSHKHGRAIDELLMHPGDEDERQCRT